MLDIFFVTVVVFILNYKDVKSNSVLGKTDFLNHEAAIRNKRKNSIVYRYNKNTVNLSFNFFYKIGTLFNISGLNLELLRYFFQLLVFHIFFFLVSKYFENPDLFYVIILIIIYSPLKKYGWYMHVNYSETPYNGIIALGISLNFLILYLFGYENLILITLPFLFLVHVVHGLIFFTIIFFYKLIFFSNFMDLVSLLLSFSLSFLVFYFFYKKLTKNKTSSETIDHDFLDKYLGLRAKSLFVRSVLINHKWYLSPPVLYLIIIVLQITYTLLNNSFNTNYNSIIFLSIFPLTFIYLQFLLSDVLNLKFIRKLALSRGTSYGIIFFIVILSILLSKSFYYIDSTILKSIIIFSLLITIFSKNVKHNIVIIPFTILIFYLEYNYILISLIMIFSIQIINSKYFGFKKNLYINLKALIITSLLVLLQSYIDPFFLCFIFLALLSNLMNKDLETHEKAESWIELQKFSKKNILDDCKFLVPAFPCGFDIHSNKNKTFDAEDSMYPIYTDVLYKESKDLFFFLNINEKDNLVQKDFLKTFREEWNNLNYARLIELKKYLKIKYLVRSNNDPLVNNIKSIYKNKYFSIFKI